MSVLYLKITYFWTKFRNTGHSAGPATITSGLLLQNDDNELFFFIRASMFITHMAFKIN
jgi:hypothetical protein